MKKNILFFSFLFFVGITNTAAQQLTDAGNNWNLLETIWLSGKTNNYSIGPDTMVNGLTYKSILKNGSLELFQDLITPSFIRQTDDGKVYVNNHLYFDTDEILIYDFGLEVMDTFTLAPSTESSLERKFIITAIDTVTLLDGDPHQQFTLELIHPQFNFTLQWVKGIGELYYGPFYHHTLYVFDIGANLLCAYEEETVKVYQNPQFDSCFVTLTSVQELNPTSPIKIYPNPVQDLLNIEFSTTDYSFTEIHIFNTLGASVYHQTNTSEVKEIDASQWTPGIYYVVLKEKSGTSFSEKIIKQ